MQRYFTSQIEVWKYQIGEFSIPNLVILYSYWKKNDLFLL